MRPKTREIVMSLSILAGALILQFFIIPNYIDMEESYDLASLSPAFFPELATWIIAGLSAVLFLSNLSHKKRTKEETHRLSPRELRRVYTSIAIVVAYLFAMTYVGFLISTIVLLLVLFLLQGMRQPFKMALGSLAVTFGVYGFFLYVMQVHFPSGILFG